MCDLFDHKKSNRKTPLEGEIVDNHCSVAIAKDNGRKVKKENLHFSCCRGLL